jgi:hypothetical protein
MKMGYVVGQVLYVVPSKQVAIYPMQVIKEVIEKTLNGTETSYVLRGGSDPKTTVKLEEIQGEIFDSAETARMTLIDRATKQITRIVEQAVRKSQEWYPNGVTDVPAADSNDIIAAVKRPGRRSDADAVLEMDGVIVNVKLPEQLKG